MDNSEIITTPDINTNNRIRLTDNSLRETDFKPELQVNRPLTEEEIAAHLESIIKED